MNDLNNKVGYMIEYAPFIEGAIGDIPYHCEEKRKREGFLDEQTFFSRLHTLQNSKNDFSPYDGVDICGVYTFKLHTINKIE